MDRKLQFRQPLYHNGKKFGGFHYWGFDEEGIFTSPFAKLNETEKLIGSQQLTGLTDKHGKDVFEGDVVTIQNNLGETEPPFLIKWRKDILNFVGEGGHGEWLMLEEFEGCEKIGNIYENPKLIVNEH